MWYASRNDNWFQNGVILLYRIQLLVIQGNGPLGLVNRKHFGEVDEFRARYQMSELRLIDPGTLFIHTYR